MKFVWLLLLLTVSSALAQVQFTGTYTQNFDGLSIGTGQTSLTWSNNSTLPGWYGALRVSNVYSDATSYAVRKLAGGENVGATSGLQVAAATISLTDHALGIQSSPNGSSSTEPMVMALRLTNKTGGVITAFTITFTGEQWSQGYSPVPSRTESLAFSYSTNATNYNTGAFTVVPALQFDGPVQTQTTNSGTTLGLNGNSNNHVFTSVVVTLSSPWQPDADLWVRWTPSAPLVSTSRGGILAIDDLTITASSSGAPSISSQPTPQTVNAGDPVTFTVTATGDPVLAYQWRKNGNPISGATSASYQIAAAASTDAGSYDVIITNSAGSATSNAAALTVLNSGMPTINTQPTSQTVTIGGTATLTVDASGEPVLTYQWRKGGAPISGATSKSLVLSNVTNSAEATYDVVVSNSLGSVTSNGATLTVNGSPVAPDITTEPTSQSVSAGATAVFSVVATGTPSPAYQWRKAGVPISRAMSATLTLPQVTSADAAGYDVVVTNSAGSVTSYLVTLTVSNQLAPTIYLQPSSHQVAIGMPVTFQVITIGSPTPSFQWRKDGTPIAGANSPSFTITSCQTGDSGSYDVVVSNSVGSVTSSVASLSVISVTPGVVRYVDQRGGTPYATIAAAAAVVQPGDTIQLVAGSGPYHETIYITASGTEASPIVFDGNGETISGYQSFQFTQQGDGSWTYTLPTPLAQTLPGGNSNTFRYLVTYQGQRLLADQVHGTQTNIRFTTPYATLSADGTMLILNVASGASPTDGWEIGGNLSYGVRIAGSTSHHVYRHLRATGMSDDGFNVHGHAQDLHFEDIEAFNNFDEGFSSHDVTQSIIDGGVFWGNDNGLLNQTRDTLVCIANNVKCFSNLGYGYCTKAGLNILSNVEVWDSGVQNMTVGGMTSFTNVVTYKTRWTQRPWVAFQESQNFTIAGKQAGDYALVLYTNANFGPLVLGNGTPEVREAASLPPLMLGAEDWRGLTFTTAELANPAISGWAADPDGDGIPNLLEYAFGLDPHSPDGAGLTSALVDGRLTLEYPRRKYNTDVALVPEVTLDLSSWGSGPSIIEEMAEDRNDYVPGLEVISARDIQAGADTARARFIRVRAVQP